MNLRPHLFPVIGLFLIFFVLAVGLSLSGLATPMQYDSAAKLEVRSHFFAEGLPSAFKLFPQRPLPVLSFYLDYLLTGMWPVHFRMTNLFLWASLCTVVVLLVGLILQSPSLSEALDPGERKWLCILAGLAFLVHPLQTYVTLYIWQRTALMACQFYYSALALYFAVRVGKVPGGLCTTGLTLVLFVCSVLSKENAVTLPVFIFVAELALFRQAWKAALIKAMPFFIALLAVVALMTYLQFPHGNERLSAGLSATLGAYYGESGLGLKEVALTQCRVLFHYLSLILAPLPGRVQLVSPQGISRSLFDPPETLPAVVAATLLVLVGLCLLKKRPLSGFGILFYVVNLIPEALLVPQYAFFAYRAVLPMLGVYLVVLDGIIALLDTFRHSRYRSLARHALVGLVACAIVLMGISTAMRASIWGQEVRFWKEMISRFPQTFDRSESHVIGQAFANLANAYYREGRYAEALDWLLRAQLLMPDNVVVRASLGFTYDRMGEQDKAETAFREAIRFDPDLRAAHQGLGELLARQGRREEAATHLQKATRPSGKLSSP